MTAHTPDQQRLLDVYAQHPLREESILARIKRQRGTLDGITELDLAHDTLTEITDQNHVGGVEFVVRLASQAGIGPSSRVLDVGAGLGGSARCLAWLFGCRVEGVDLSPGRCADGDRLTERVKLGDRVTCRCGDILTVDLPAPCFDVVWGQGAWMHVADTSGLFQRAAGTLVPGGRIAFEESCLMASPRGAAERQALEELERLWVGRFLPRETWEGALARAGFHSCAAEDVTAAFVDYFDRLATIAKTTGLAAYPTHETAAFTRAIELAQAGVIGYFRFVARR